MLNERVHRFGELRRAIPGITQHMLTARLRELEGDGLITRKVFAEVPPRVDYAITQKAAQLRPVFDAIFAWSSEQDRPDRKGPAPRKAGKKITPKR